MHNPLNFLTCKIHLLLTSFLALALLLCSAPLLVLAKDDEEMAETIYELEDYANTVTSASDDLLCAEENYQEAQDYYLNTLAHYQKCQKELTDPADANILTAMEDVVTFAKEQMEDAKKEVTAAKKALSAAKKALKAFTDLEQNENISVNILLTTAVYTGKAIELGPDDLEVFYNRPGGNACPLYENVDYNVTYENNVNAGTATVNINGIGDWHGTKSAALTIGKAKSSVKLAAQTKTYTGKALAYSGKVTRQGSKGKITYAYYSDAKCTKAIKAANVIDPGTYYVKATLKADTNFKQAKSAAVKFTVKKAKNPLTVTSSKKTIKYSAVKKKARTAAPVTVSASQGDLSYRVTKWTTSKAKKYFTVNASTGQVTAKKGTPKGTYNFQVRVSAAESTGYLAASRTVTVRIVVK